MRYLARRTTAGKPLHATGFPLSQTEQLRDLARRVRHLGRGSRHWCAETFLLERDTIGRELELVADELGESGR
jgi:hypothetical protein